MDFITPQNRKQIAFSSLDDKITADNAERFVAGFFVELEMDKIDNIVAILKRQPVSDKFN